MNFIMISKWLWQLNCHENSLTPFLSLLFASGLGGTLSNRVKGLDSNAFSII